VTLPGGSSPVLLEQLGDLLGRLVGPRQNRLRGRAQHLVLGQVGGFLRKSVSWIRFREACRLALFDDRFFTAASKRSCTAPMLARSRRHGSSRNFGKITTAFGTKENSRHRRHGYAGPSPTKGAIEASPYPLLSIGIKTLFYVGFDNYTVGTGARIPALDSQE
jgi:hypothetical protein